MKKKILFLFPAVLLLMIIVFWQEVTAHVIAISANQYTLKKFGVPLNSDGVFKKEGYWVIDHPQVLRKDVSLGAEQILVKFDFDLLKRHLSIEMKVKESLIAIGSDTTDLSTLFADIVPNSLPYWLSNTLYLTSICDVDHGQASWEARHKETETVDFCFHGEGKDDSKSVDLVVWMDETVKDKNRFRLQLQKIESDSVKVGLAFHQVECGKIARGFEAAGHPLEGWEFLSGLINGEIELVWPEHHAPYALGKAVVTDLSFEHPVKCMTGEIKEAVLDLQMERIKGQLPSLVGKIELNHNASVSFHRHRKPFWKIDQLIGGIYFQPERSLKVALQGECTHESRDFQLNIDGEAKLIDKKKAALEVALHLSSDHERTAVARFVAKQLGPHSHQAQMAFENIGPDEFAFVQEVLGRYSPDWQSFHVQRGVMNASGTAKMHGWNLTDLTIEQVDISQLHFEITPLDLSASVDFAAGNLSVHLMDAEPLKTVNADFTISDGQLIAANLAEVPCCFTHIQTLLSIRQGVVQQSELQGEFAGLKGTIGVDWMAKDKVLTLHFAGSSEKLAPFLPLYFRSSYMHSFSQQDLEVRAGVALNNNQMNVEGSLRLSDQLVSFGFDLEKSSEKLWKRWPANELATAYWDSIGQEVMQTVLPPIASPAILFETNWIRAESGIGGLVFRNGWFKADSLNLERFLTPFLFPNGQMELSGKGNFHGVFNQHLLAVEYEAENVLMENRFLSIKAEKIGSHPRSVAAHYFDFKKGTHFGSLSLRDAEYLEKNSGLVFTPTNTLVTLEGKKAHLTQVETECLGVRMAGNIDLDFGEPDDDIFDLEISVQSMKGSLAQAKEFVARFQPDFFIHDLPVDGSITLRDEGALFRFSFIPGDFSLDAVVKGEISNGKAMQSTDSQLGLNDIHFQFAYDHRNHLLDVANFRGAIHWDGISTGYFLYGDHVHFEDIENGQSNFDVWLGDHSRDLIRLVGKTKREWDLRDQPIIAVHIDHELTHAGNIHPGSFQLWLKNWLEVEKFQLGLHIELESLLNDLRLLSRSGLGAALGKYAKDVQMVQDCSGCFDMNVSYEGEPGLLSYKILGSDFAFNQFTANSVQLLGTRNEEHWFVDRLQWDDKIASGELFSQNEEWQVKNLHFQNKDIVSVLLHGRVNPAQKKWEGRVENIRIDLAQMSGTPEIEMFTAVNNPHGHLHGQGNLKFEWGQAYCPWRMDAILDMALVDWDAKAMHFENAQNVSCHYVSDQGLTLRNLRTKVVDKETGSSLAQIQIEKIQYEFPSGEILFDDLHFQVPAHHLPRFAEQLKLSFPDVVKPAISEVIRDSKLEGVLEGVLKYEMTPPYSAMRLSLSDGTYHFLNAEHAVNQFVVEYDPFEFSLTSGYRLGGRNVWMYGRSSSPSLAYGELIVTETAPDQVFKRSPQEALYFNWENHPQTGLNVCSVEGAFQGLKVQLEKDPMQSPSKDALFLVGSVEIDGQRAKEFFPDQMAEKIVEWKIGSGYQLQGKWRFLKNHSENYGDKLHFVGTLKGDHFYIRGYQVDSLVAYLEYTPTVIRINDLQVRDTSGVLISDRVDFLKTELGSWAFAMPSMTVHHFRPCLLQEAGSVRPNLRKPFVIQELVLEGTQGNLTNSRSIIGRGEFHFTNRSKKLLQNTIFQIPSDILSRIGLDLSVLTPVSGTVQYEIRDGRIYLNKFKDVYSDAKLSKFYLAGGSPSTVDFDGGLNLQVKMKQYNLIFKLAELFTFNIQGNLVKPVYSVQKHHGDVAGSN
jgi:hypothetical protein